MKTVLISAWCLIVVCFVLSGCAQAPVKGLRMDEAEDFCAQHPYQSDACASALQSALSRDLRVIENQGPDVLPDNAAPRVVVDVR